MAISALNEAVDLMWETPANKPCNVIYEVSVQPGGDAVNVTQQRASVTGLSNGVQYTFTIRAISPQGRGGAVSVAATPAASSLVKPSAPASPAPAKPTVASGLLPDAALPGWTCGAGAGPYPVCEAGKAGLCAPVTCGDLAKSGFCDSTYLRTTDWGARRVTQHCAAECPCRAAPALRQTLERASPDWCCAFSAAQYFAGADGRATNGLE